MMSIIDGSCRGLDSAERAAKRLRSDKGNDGWSEKQLTLPPEVWAAVMEYTPFETILSCAATCRSMLHDSCKMLTTLRINKPLQLNLAVASRFRDVREIHINSLLCSKVVDDEYRYSRVDFETKNRAVPYLTCFSKLQRVFFGAIDGAGAVHENFDPVNEHFWEGDDIYPNDGEGEKLLQFIDSISVGFRCGALPKCLKISGLCCPYSYLNSRRRECVVCTRAIKSFPLESVLSFECRGSSSNRALSGRSFCLDVCLDRTQMEKIIESRPGGRELLRSEERLLKLLGKATRYKIVADQEKPLYIVKYSNEQIDEIQRVIRYAHLDVKRLTKEKIIAAIKRSFARDAVDPVPPYHQCYFSKTSLDQLKGKIGLGIVSVDFERPLREMAMNAKQIAWVLIHGHLRTFSDEDDDSKGQYGDIELDCLNLVCRFMEEIDTNRTINQIILPAIEEAIPRIVKHLDMDAAPNPDASSTIKNILIRGTEEQRNIIVEAGAIPPLSLLLRSPKDCIAIDALTSLCIIVTARKYDHIQKVAKAEAIAENLLYLIESKDDDWTVKTSLTILAATKHSLPLHHLLRFIDSPNWTGVLVECSIILKQTLEGSKPPFKPIIDSGVLPRLVEIIRTTTNPTIQKNLAHVMMTIACSDQQTSLLADQLSSFFLGFQDSYYGATAEKAVSALYNVASVGTGTWVSCFEAARNSLPPHQLVEYIKSPDWGGVLAECSTLLRLILRIKPRNQKKIDSGVLLSLVQLIRTTDDLIVQANLASIMMSMAYSNKQAAVLWEELILFFLGLQDSSCDATAEKAISTLHNIASVGTGTWVSWKENPSLRWGEFDVKGELVDSDEESDVSFEEAEEVDDTQLKLEVMQSTAANARKNETVINVDQYQFETLKNESPNLMGMSDFLIEKIIHFVDISEVALLEGVCKRFRCLSTRSYDFWQCYPGNLARTRKLALHIHGLRQIRRFQTHSGGDGDILDVLGETKRAEIFRTLCSDLLSRMIHLNDGPAVHFRLRGDTIYYLAELMQGFMVCNLENALSVAIHCNRTKVQEEDILFAFKNKFQSILYSSSSQMTSERNEHNRATYSNPIASGNVWSWPGDDACHDVLPPEAGRRIIRKLAYRAGINEMTNGAFLLAEAKLLHTMGTLLADAFESSAAMAKSASFLDTDVALVYRMPMISGPTPPCLDTDDSSIDSFGQPLHENSFSDEDEVEIHDMFKAPPPPFGPDVTIKNPSNETIYTIAPGQIAATAEQRKLTPNIVYGYGWVASSGFTQEEERKIEESYYYKPYYEDYSDTDSDSSDDEDSGESPLCADNDNETPVGEDTEESSSDYSDSDWDSSDGDEKEESESDSSDSDSGSSDGEDDE